MDQQTITFALNWIILMAPLIKWWAKSIFLEK
jgi:hypothetical protein